MIDGRLPSFFLSYRCDITAGQYAAIPIFGFPKIEDKPILFEMTFTFHNLIMQYYKCKIEMIVMYEGSGFSSHILNYVRPVQIEMESDEDEEMEIENA